MGKRMISGRTERQKGIKNNKTINVSMSLSGYG